MMRGGRALLALGFGALLAAVCGAEPRRFDAALGALCEPGDGDGGPGELPGTMLLQRGAVGLQASLQHRGTLARQPDSGYPEVRYVVQQCASETSLQPPDCPECLLDSTCQCNGHVRFGYGLFWSTWTPVSGSIECGVAVFGDPYPQHAKICSCRSALLSPAARPPASGGPAAVGADHLLATASVWAVVALTMTYFVVYCALALVRCHNQATNVQSDMKERVLQSTTLAVNFAPMLSALIFAVNKRADVLAAGRPGGFGLPPQYLRGAIAVCTAAFCAQTVFYLVGEWHFLRDYVDAPPQGITPRAAKMVKFWSGLFNCSLLLMYTTLFIIVFGAAHMSEPGEVHMMFGNVPMSVGTFCCTCLGVLYFFVYGMLHVAKASEVWQCRVRGPEAAGHPPTRVRFSLEVLQLASTTLSFAPMLSILFLGAQMTADAQHGRLPDFVETSMYLCSFVVILQVTLAILGPFVTNAELRVVPERQEVDFVARSHNVFLLISICRWAAMTALYVGVALVCWYDWSLTAVPLWSRLLTHLATYFFIVHLLLWIVFSLRQLRGSGFTSAIRTLSTAKDMVAFCPMLAMLVMESWVRAGRLTIAKGTPGVPQGFAQDYMVVAAFALFVQVLTVALHSLLCGKFQEPQYIEKPSSLVQVILNVLATLLHAATVTMYFSLGIVLLALFTIVPASATGEGAWLA